MIDNMWFDTLQQTFSKMHFSWKLSLMLVTGVTFLMDNNSEDQYIRSDVIHWRFIVSLVLLYCFFSVTLNK